MRVFAFILVVIALAACSTAGPVKPRPSAQEPQLSGAPPAPAVQPREEHIAIIPATNFVRPHEAPAAPAPPPDLWERVRDGLQLGHYRHRRIDLHTHWFARNQSHLDEVMGRARPFLHLIVEEVERRGLPLELALVPAVESTFKPFAYSRKGAAGLWQFTGATGRSFGLRQTWWYDGRRDVLASTRAALDYLEYLHRRLKGDWLLTLAAYNAGDTAVRRAIRRNRRAGRPTDFWSLPLPRETRNYVPKILGLAAVIAEPARYDVELEKIIDEPKLASVSTGGQIDLAVAAKLAGMSLREFRHYNPAFKRWATAPQGPHKLLLPIAKRDEFTQKLAALPARERVAWQRHSIRRGESLGYIARRYGTTIHALKQVNQLRGNRIHAGRQLIIPVATAEVSAYQVAALQGRGQTRTYPPRTNQKIIYTVRRGDSFWSIARRYKVPIRKLARWNGLTPRAMLHPGKKLVIWLREDAQAT